MKLSDANDLDVSEARYLFETTILEDGEGPRWKFNYDNWHNDPKPDILLLGAYKHPRTRNNLVGGINLHYINQDQRDRLARALPQIMQSNNLRRRYWLGRQLVPDVFVNYYRTYNSRFVRGVTKDVMYPKYGYLKTAQNWLKKKLSSLFKSKKQREQDNQPKYPDDLKTMQDRLDQAVSSLAAQPSDDPQDTPEMQAATRAFQDYRRQQTLRDLERRENEPMVQAQQELDQAQQTPGIQRAERNIIQQPTVPVTQPTASDTQPPASTVDQEKVDQLLSRQQIDSLTQQNKQNNSRLKDADPNADLQIGPEKQDEPASQPTKPKASNQIQSQDQATPPEAEPEAEPEPPIIDDQDLDENVIYYYSPNSKRYILEHIQLH